ncbi:MAG: hypothetical protein K2H48_01440 [Duncaniella sp.]|nr:hypothetical protein [Duncaniella sp.]
MEKQIIAIEIDKYLRNPEKVNPLSKIVKESIIGDFLPTSLYSFNIDKDSINSISKEDETYEFYIQGEIVFTDASSKVSVRVKDNYHGIAHLAKFEDRYYVDWLQIDSLPSDQKILSCVVK